MPRCGLYLRRVVRKSGAAPTAVKPGIRSDLIFAAVPLCRRYLRAWPAVLTDNLDITKVTFTVRPTGHRMSVWFGSSGGGLPRRPELSSGRFFALSPHTQTE